MDDAVGDGVSTQGGVNGGGFVGDRLQLGDGLGETAGGKLPPGLGSSEESCFRLEKSNSRILLDWIVSTSLIE